MSDVWCLAKPRGPLGSLMLCLLCAACSGGEGGDEGEAYENAGNYLMILRKESNGSWRVSHYIWNDPVTAVQ